MTAIGVIDDRDVDRQIIADNIELSKNSDNWSVVDSEPLPTLVDYPSWISQNKICALVIDEMLDETIINGEAVDYRGHNLVDFIRSRLPTLPVFVITAWSSDNLLQERFKDVEEIITRTEFSTEYRKYVPRILRAAQKYLEVFESELSQLSDFAQKVAKGNPVNSEEKERAQAIQSKLGLSHSIGPITEIGTWLEEANYLVNQIDELKRTILHNLEENE